MGLQEMVGETPLLCEASAAKAGEKEGDNYIKCYRER